MSDPAEYLLINNNNTRTKFALAGRDGVIDFRAVMSRALDTESFRSTVQGWKWQKVVMASVVPSQAALLRSWVEGSPLLEISHEIELGVEVDFSEPAGVGADRLANAAAVVGLYQTAPAIVVDFGTALTFDVVSSERAYIGGVIAPGLDAMTEYLHQRTALLPRLNLEEPPQAIGRSTTEAMLSGAVHGYRGLVREILARICAELHQRDPKAAPPKIVATGGHAPLIAAGLDQLSNIDEHLTLEGLRIIANLNVKT